MLALWLLLQVIPEHRTADWARAGVPARPERTRIVEVQGDPQAAIDAAEPETVLFLPAGTYDGLRLKSRITLRGAGPSKTILKGTIHVGAGGADWWYPNRLRVDVQGERGDGRLRVSDGSRLEPGMVVQLARKNGSAVVSTRGFDFLQRQVTRIVAKTPTHVTVSPAPLFDLPEGSRLAPAGRMAEFVGIENLGVEDAGSFGIRITGGYGCWVENVAVRYITGYHISLSDSLFCEVRRSLVWKRAEGGSDHAGIQLATSSSCKIEDNILLEQHPHIALSGSSGNVVAYNLCRDSDIYGALGPSLSANQGPHSSFNLYEGNVAPKFQAEGHDGSGSHDTVFRNRLHGTSPFTSKAWVCVSLQRLTRDASVVGNVLGAPGHAWLYDGAETGAGPDPRLIFAFGGPSKDVDPDVRRTAFLRGNFNYKDRTVPPEEATGALPKSLYLSAKPEWWGDLAWPPFGPDVAFERNKIPAETRD